MLKIGMIDSGMGGLSVLKGLVDSGVNAEYYYLYDNKYHPYGSKSQSELVAIGYSSMQKLMDFKVDIVIIACNTLTAGAVSKLRGMFDIPIIGVEPPIKPATMQCENILLLATPSTVKSDRVMEMMHSFTNKNFYFPDMSKLANLIEENYSNKEIIYRFLTDNLAKYKDIQGIVIGCTHYNFAVEEIHKIYPDAKIFSNTAGVVKRTQYIINKNKFIVPNYLAVKVYSTGNEIDIEKKYFLCDYLGLGIEFYQNLK